METGWFERRHLHHWTVDVVFWGANSSLFEVLRVDEAARNEPTNEKDDCYDSGDSSPS